MSKNQSNQGRLPHGSTGHHRPNAILDLAMDNSVPNREPTSRRPQANHPSTSNETASIQQTQIPALQAHIHPDAGQIRVADGENEAIDEQSIAGTPDKAAKEKKEWMSKKRIRAKPSLRPLNNRVFPDTIHTLAQFQARDDRRAVELNNLRAQPGFHELPITNQLRQNYAKKMFYAFYYLGNELVARGQAADRIAGDFYPARVVETKCWEIIDKANYAEYGIRNCEPHEGHIFEEYHRFEDRMDMIVEGMRVNKDYCKTIVEGGDKTSKLADAPETELRGKGNNKKINDLRNVQVKLGKAAMTARSPDKQTTNILGRAQGVAHVMRGGRISETNTSINASPEDADGIRTANRRANINASTRGRTRAPLSNASRASHRRSRTRGQDLFAEPDEAKQKQIKLTICRLLGVEPVWATRLNLNQLQFIVRRYDKKEWNNTFQDSDGVNNGLFRNHKIRFPESGDVVDHFAQLPGFEAYRPFFEARGEIDFSLRWAFHEPVRAEKEWAPGELESEIDQLRKADFAGSVDIGEKLKAELGII